MAEDLDQMARDVLDTVRYVALGTIDDDGRPRVSPVYFVPHGYTDLYWVSHLTDPAERTVDLVAGFTDLHFGSVLDDRLTAAVAHLDPAWKPNRAQAPITAQDQAA